jgi:hypothetical protein
VTVPSIAFEEPTVVIALGPLFVCPRGEGERLSVAGFRFRFQVVSLPHAHSALL